MVFLDRNFFYSFFLLRFSQKEKKANLLLLRLPESKYFSCQTEISYYLSSLTYYPFIYVIQSPSLAEYFSSWCSGWGGRGEEAECLYIIEYLSTGIFEENTHLWERFICPRVVSFSVLEFYNWVLYSKDKYFFAGALFNQVLIEKPIRLLVYQFNLKGQRTGYNLSFPEVTGNIAFSCRHTVNTKNACHTTRIEYLASTRQIWFCWYFNYMCYKKSTFISLDFKSILQITPLMEMTQRPTWQHEQPTAQLLHTRMAHSWGSGLARNLRSVTECFSNTFYPQTLSSQLYFITAEQQKSSINVIVFPL